jgi:hypothetical protein
MVVACESGLGTALYKVACLREQVWDMVYVDVDLITQKSVLDHPTVPSSKPLRMVRKVGVPRMHSPGSFHEQRG